MLEKHVPRTDGENYYCTLCDDYCIKITDSFQNIRKHYIRMHHQKLFDNVYFVIQVKNNM